MSKVSFNNNNSPFFSALRKKVDRYFKETGYSRSGNTGLYLKGIMLVSAAVASYVTLVFFTPAAAIALPLCALLGFVIALIGFNVMHEGAHNSYSDNKLINKISAYSLNCLGGNAYFWQVKHNFNHHTYTNIDGHDADIDIAPFMRQHENHTLKKMHRFQHIYCHFLYAISYFDWIFLRDFEKYFTAKITNDSKLNLTPKVHFVFWFTKLVYFFVYVFLPIYMVGFWQYLLGFTILSGVTGLVLGMVFQMAHVVELTDFPMPNETTNKIDEEWAVHQIKTTANFATDNAVVSWCLGGLNFQVEHHLFPKINHVHYPALSKLVKETCAEFGINYLEYPTVTSAFGSHLNYLKRMGNPVEEPASLPSPILTRRNNISVQTR